MHHHENHHHHHHYMWSKNYATQLFMKLRIPLCLELLCRNSVPQN